MTPPRAQGHDALARDRGAVRRVVERDVDGGERVIDRGVVGARRAGDVVGNRCIGRGGNLTAAPRRPPRGGEHTEPSTLHTGRIAGYAARIN